jgi:hypothetical protein
LNVNASTRRIASLAVFLLSASIPAFAQSGGLFGATRDDTADRDRLNVGMMLGAAFDTELPPLLLAQTSQVTPQSGGFSTLASGTAQYAHTRRRAQIAATAKTSFRYFGNVDRLDALGHSAGIGADIRLTRLTNLRINQSAAYTPSYLYDLIPASAPPELGDTIETAPDFHIVQDDSYSYRSAFTLSVGGTGRGPSVQVGGGYERTRYAGERTDRTRLTSYNGHATFTQHLRRNLGLSADYEYRTGDYGIGLSNEHRIAVGIDYTRRLSSSRHANFRFNVGRSVLDTPVTTADGEILDRLDRMGADLNVTYELKRGWGVGGSVRRSIEYTPLFREPLLSDGASVSLTGLLTRRVDVTATAGYAKGGSAVNELNTLKTYTGNVMARFALRRWVAFYGEYVYFYYDLQRRELLNPNLPAVYEQHGVRFGLTLWASAF